MKLAAASIDDVLVKSITGWHHQEVANRTDIDQTRIDFGGTSATGGPLITDGEPGEGTQIQQEVQLNGSAWDGRINFVTGPDQIAAFSQRHATMTDIFAPAGLITTAAIGGGITTRRGSNRMPTWRQPWPGTPRHRTLFRRCHPDRSVR